MNKPQYCRICSKKFTNEKLHTKRYHIVRIGNETVHVAEDYIEWYD